MTRTLRPRAISFLWTAAPLLHGRKTVTRRDWQPGYAASFHAGDIVIATDKRLDRGGKPLARLRLTRAPYLEDAIYAPDEDYEGEGFKFLEEHPRFLPKGEPPWSWAAYERWRIQRGEMWVIRFEVIERLADPPSLETSAPKPAWQPLQGPPAERQLMLW